MAKTARELRQASSKTVRSVEWSEDKGVLWFRGKIYVSRNIDLQRQVVSLCHNTKVAGHPGERGKRDVDCDKQIVKAVTALNCVLKGSWGERGSKGIRKKLKSEYAAYLESKYRRNDGNSI